MYYEFKQKMDSLKELYGEKNYFYFMRDDSAANQMTYCDMHRIISGMERKFANIGFQKGDRVVLVAPISPSVILTGLSLSYAGITSVLLDASLPVEEIKKLINISDVRAIFTNDTLYHSLKDSFEEKLDFFKLIEDEFLQSHGSDTDILQLKAAKTIDAEEDVIAIIFSSGTTGTMKGIKITYKSIVKSPELFKRFIVARNDGKILYVFPFNHIAGYVICYVFTFLGWELGLIENMNASKLQKGLLEFNPHLFAIVPKVFEVMEQKIRAKIQEKGKVVEAALNILMEICYFLRTRFGLNLGKYLFKGVRDQVFGTNIEHVGGGGTMFKASNAKFFYSLGLNWSDVYASTETGVPTLATGILDKTVAGTIGNVNRHPEISIKIANADENGEGEILIKSELMMKGYFRQPDLTKEAFDAEGYFHTGDSGVIDKKGYLHIAGRIKESIVLQSGKKVSPTDVDNYYLEKAPQYDLASKGIASEDKQFDRIHLFIKNDNYEAAEKEKIRKAFLDISRNAPAMYQLSGIHFVKQIEKTSIGKTKRYLLKIEEDTIDASKPSIVAHTSEEKYLNIIQNYCSIEKISMEQNLKDELGIDSLTMYEIITELEKSFGVDLSLTNISFETVGELFDAISNHSSMKTDSDIDYTQFPMRKSSKDIKKLSFVMKVVQRLWKFEVKGLENISENENYIICPNHESHFDGLFVFSALNKNNIIDLRKICCMAKKEHLEHQITRDWLKMLGGIPVDRYGASSPAIQKSVQCIKEGYTLLIHPEGTRTRNGELGKFKSGAAKLAEKTGSKILPVRIDGAYELYPHDKKLPKLFDWKHFRRCRLTISFGEAIDKGNYTSEELMDRVRESVVALGKTS